MKKNFIYVLFVLIIMVAFVGRVSATEKSETLQDAVNDEIKTFGGKENYEDAVNKLKNIDLSNYKNEDNKVNIYIFRGSSCPHCLDAIVFFAEKAEEYGKYYNIVSYETWNNSDNARLMDRVGRALGEEVSGVPYIVVGNKSYAGFNESTGVEILEQVKSLYNSTDRYDVFDNLGNKDNTKTVVVIVLVFLVAIVGLGFLVYVSKSE